MKSRPLMSCILLLALVVTPAVLASTPCIGMERKLVSERKTAVALAIAKQLKVPSVEVLNSFGVGNWLGVYVDTHQSDEVFLFFAADPVAASYASLWSGAARRDETPALKAWAEKENPGIPPALAMCFAWFVTSGR